MLSIKINGKEIEYNAPTSYTIEWFYDRHQRGYMVQVIDNFENVTETTNEPDKKCRDMAINWFKEKYNTTSVKRN